MKGLLVKEMAMMEDQLKSWLVVLGVMFAYSYFMKSNNFIYMCIWLCGLMVTMTLFSLDKASQWDSYVRCLPLKKRDVVMSRYLFAILYTIVIAMAGLILASARNVLAGETLVLWENLSEIYRVLVFTFFLQAVVLPVLYKVGAEKARYIFMAMMMLPFIAAAYAARREVQLPVPSQALMQILQVLLPVFLAVLMVISWGISVRIYCRQEV